MAAVKRVAAMKERIFADLLCNRAGWLGELVGGLAGGGINDSISW